MRTATSAGVSRIADLTGLDTLGIPVFQAVRPWSRALSVHQGKGWTASAARIGAAMEAVESATAEAFEGEAVARAFDDLSRKERPDQADDIASRRGAIDPSRAILWTPARRLGGGTSWTSWWGVSLDCTRRGEPDVERSSNGLAAAFDLPRAELTALCEVLERDAVAEWRAQPLSRRASSVLATDDLPSSVLQTFLSRSRDLGVEVKLYVVASVIGWPVALCEMVDGSTTTTARHHIYGSACRPRALEALDAACLEAAQTRLTFISAARDDIYPQGARAPAGLGMAAPLPPGLSARAWVDVVAGDEPDAEPTAGLAAERLARVGYPGAAIVDLACPYPDAVVVKAVVPGLGAYGRRRRAPVSA